MGYAAMFADYTWFENYIERIEGVTPDQIQSAAERYLGKENRIIGVFRPRKS